MENEQMYRLLEAHFSMLEANGVADKNDLIAIIYLIFIDEYYEYFRNISFQDIDNNEIGLTDCMVKKLNDMIECLKLKSNLVRCVGIEYLCSKYHWIIPDDHTDPDIPGEDSYIEGNVIYTKDNITGSLWTTENLIDNNTLTL